MSNTTGGRYAAQTMLPSGATVGEWLEPQLEAVYNSGRMPPLLLGAPQDD